MSKKQTDPIRKEAAEIPQIDDKIHYLFRGPDSDAKRAALFLKCKFPSDKLPELHALREKALDDVQRALLKGDGDFFRAMADAVEQKTDERAVQFLEAYSLARDKTFNSTWRELFEQETGVTIPKVLSLETAWAIAEETNQDFSVLGCKSAESFKRKIYALGKELGIKFEGKPGRPKK